MAPGSVGLPPGFGRAEDPGWQPSAAHDPAEVLSTYAAHRVWRAVRQAWRRVYPQTLFNGQNLAQMLGAESVRPWQKRLAGAQPLRLADVLVLAAIFGDDIVAALPQDSTELFPSAYRHLLHQWKPGTGVPPVFAEPDEGTIDWQRAVADLAVYDADEHQAHRSDLLTAETYRYTLALLLEEQGVPIDRFQPNQPTIPHSCAMTLYSQSRLTIVTSDIRQLASRDDAAAALMDILYQTFETDAYERVLVLVAGAAAVSQIAVYVPGALRQPGHRFTLTFQQALGGGLHVDHGEELRPDIDLIALGQAHGPANRQVIALHVGK